MNMTYAVEKFLYRTPALRAAQVFGADYPTGDGNCVTPNEITRNFWRLLSVFQF